MSSVVVPSRTRAGNLGLVLGPLLAIACWVGPHFGWALDAQRPLLNNMAGIAVLMAVWWLTEAIPNAATGLVPLALFPLFSIMGAGDTARSYGHSMLFLFLGGFLVALAVEQSGLHRRIALSIVAAVGDSPRQLVLGFMLATAGLSMWISNTATTMMMLPIAASVLLQAGQAVANPSQDESRRLSYFGVALLLGIAYSASIGGFATLIGTPTNLVFKELYQQLFDGRAPEITFAGWMAMALPLSLTLLIVAWILMVRIIFPVGQQPFLGGREVIRSQREQLGPIRAAEWQMALIFGSTSLLWIFREPVPGWGWAHLLGVGELSGGPIVADDATVAMAMALLCFILPGQGLRGAPLLNWEIASKTPWGILLLFGGGLALADGMQRTGLDVYLGQSFGQGLAGTSALGVAASISTGMTFLTELTGNMACVNMSMPILASLAQTIGCDPRLLMIPATIAASCAFMLPVATPPNAIVYASGRIDIRHMVWAGLWLNLASVVLTVLFLYLLGLPALGISYQGLPDWALPTGPSGP